MKLKTFNFFTGRTDDILVVSPRSSRYFVPICDDSIKPYVGQLFPRKEDGIAFYLQYATQCGFNARLATDTKPSDGSNVNVWKYLLCIR